MSFFVEKVTAEDLPEIAKQSYYRFGPADVVQKSRNPITDREKMFSDFLSFNRNSIFKITRYFEIDDEPRQSLAGYSVILPYNHGAFEDHKAGNLNLYRLSSRHVLSPQQVGNIKPSGKFYCFFHSLVTLEKFRTNFAYKRELRNLIVMHFCAVSKKAPCEAYEILAEPHSEDGKQFLQGNCFQKLDHISATGHSLWLFDSQVPILFNKKFERLFSEVYHLRLKGLQAHDSKTR